jgi:hypothetical protein
MQITAEFARTLERELAAALGAAKGALRSIDAVLADDAVCGQNYARLRVAKMILELKPAPPPAPLPEPRMMKCPKRPDYACDTSTCRHRIKHEESDACGEMGCCPAGQPVEPVCVWIVRHDSEIGLCFGGKHGIYRKEMLDRCPECGKKVEVRK